MKLLRSFFASLTRKNIIWIVVVFVVLVVGGFVVFGKEKESSNGSITINRGDFIKEVSVSGKVVPTESVDLSFSETGRVATLNVVVGDQVKKGDILASLPVGGLLSDLQAARAELAIKKAEGQNTQTNLDQIQKEQDTLVSNAYGKLLSDGLVAVPNSASNNATPPIITGRYEGPEGRMKVIVRRTSGSSANDHELFVFELETAREIRILDDEPTPLGTRGLFISFPDDLDDYEGTVWYVTIPNTKSDSYLANYNAYQEAVSTRDRTIAEARAEISQNSSSLSVSEAQIQSAEAEVSRVQAAISEKTIFAPFSGIVTKVDVKLGGISSANTPAISLISADALQIESFIPEIHTPFVKIGDEATVTLDAYGVDVPFKAKVIFLDPAETVRDGVSTYRAKLEFVQKDERIKSGMTANVVIVTEKKTGVIVVPQGAILTRDGQKFVQVRNGDEITERSVIIGNVSSLGETEIVSGLESGDIVIIPEDKE